MYKSTTTWLLDMIRMKFVNGPREGEMFEGSPKAVADVLWGMLHLGEQWSIDYENAPPEEVLMLRRQEIRIRILRTLTRGGTVIFNKQHFDAKKLGDEAKTQNLAMEIAECVFEFGDCIIERDTDAYLILTSIDVRPE